MSSGCPLRDHQLLFFCFVFLLKTSIETVHQYHANDMLTLVNIIFNNKNNILVIYIT